MTIKRGFSFEQVLEIIGEDELEAWFSAQPAVIQRRIIRNEMRRELRQKLRDMVSKEHGTED